MLQKSFKYISLSDHYKQKSAVTAALKALPFQLQTFSEFVKDSVKFSKMKLNLLFLTY